MSSELGNPFANYKAGEINEVFTDEFKHKMLVSKYERSIAAVTNACERDELVKFLDGNTSLNFVFDTSVYAPHVGHPQHQGILVLLSMASENGIKQAFIRDGMRGFYVPLHTQAGFREDTDGIADVSVSLHNPQSSQN